MWLNNQLTKWISKITSEKAKKKECRNLDTLAGVIHLIDCV